MIILVGKPGTGKSTQSKLLAQTKNYQWISTGEILRRSLKGSKLKQVEEGKLLPDEQMIEVLGPVLKQLADTQEFILDGFPRTIPQAKWLINEAQAARLKLTALINIEITDETAKQRLLKRGRADDSQAAVEKRYQIYNEVTAPMIELFKNSGLNMKTVDGNQTPDQVQSDILATLN